MIFRTCWTAGTIHYSGSLFQNRSRNTGITRMDDYDVIVAGAGPGGAVAALYAARAGLRVALIDKAEFPRHKCCGDFIPPSAITFLDEFSFRERFHAADGYRVAWAEIELLDRSRQRIGLTTQPPSHNGVILPRYHFDHALVQLAQEHGAEQITGLVTGLQREGEAVTGVQLQQGQRRVTISGRVVIGCDGSNSRMARWLNPSHRQSPARVMAIRAYIENFSVTPHTIEAFLRRDLWPGYAWIFPVNENTVNIGMGSKRASQHAGRELKSKFLQFLQSEPIAARMRPVSRITNLRAMPLNPGFDKKYPRSFAGALLAGDAAHLVNPLTGGGICNAMSSGKLAAETVIEAFGRGDFSRRSLAAYDHKLRKRVAPELIFSGYIARLLYAHPDASLKMARLILHQGPLPALVRWMYPDVRIEKAVTMPGRSG